jgi:hypothetical protein
MPQQITGKVMLQVLLALVPAFWLIPGFLTRYPPDHPQATVFELLFEF